MTKQQTDFADALGLDLNEALDWVDYAANRTKQTVDPRIVDACFAFICDNSINDTKG